ncbi:hypothetical protein MKK64_10125, partial [Methylobacterium sp. E-025]|uniref:hypothetical protein n=1 Tax=Methylobacterium sp. E-025 TaxID=2836561 RepID=UPI001FBA1CDD
KPHPGDQRSGPPSANLIRSPADSLLQARTDHASCLGLATSSRHRIAAGETDKREDHAWALGNARRWSHLAAELSETR